MLWLDDSLVLLSVPFSKEGDLVMNGTNGINGTSRNGKKYC